MVTSKTRREQEQQRHRREVLEAALNLFVEKGFERATMAEVARAAGFAVGTLYKLFEDKRALYRAIVLEICADAHVSLMEALQSPGSEIERIERYIDAKVSLYIRHKRIGPLFFARTAGAFLSPTAALEEDIQATYRQLRKVLDGLFRSGIRKKNFANRDPRALTFLLEGLTHAFLPALVDDPDSFTAEEMAAAIKSTFFDGIRL
jgi:AcrR family transcriptional regulator